MSDFSSCRSKKLSTTKIKITSSQEKTLINIVAIFFIVKLSKFSFSMCNSKWVSFDFYVIWLNCNFLQIRYFFLCNQFNKCVKTWTSFVTHIFSTILVKVYISLFYAATVFLSYRNYILGEKIGFVKLNWVKLSPI